MKKYLTLFTIIIILCGTAQAQDFDAGYEGYVLTHVKKEMSPSWNIEALKAQAVLARTFELKAGHGNKTAAADFSSNDAPTRAVTETAGLVLKYNGQIASVFYHADSGGCTTGNNEVWGGTKIPYLITRPDKFQVKTAHSFWQKSMSRAQLEDALSSRQINVGQLLSFENIQRDESGRIMSLEIVGTDGRIKLNGNKFRTAAGLKSTMVNFGESAPQKSVVRTTTKTPLRHINYIGRKRVIDRSTMPENKHEKLDWFADNRLFTVDEYMKMLAKPEKIDEYIELGMKRLDTAQNVKTGNTQQPQKTAVQTETHAMPAETNIVNQSAYTIGETITFTGRGWGHGVGLPQWQAKIMADNGWTYQQILEYYFPGLILEHY